MKWLVGSFLMLVVGAIIGAALVTTQPRAHHLIQRILPVDMQAEDAPLSRDAPDETSDRMNVLIYHPPRNLTPPLVTERREIAGHGSLDTRLVRVTSAVLHGVSRDADVAPSVFNLSLTEDLIRAGYVLDDGRALIDFSGEIRTQPLSDIRAEVLLVQAVVHSILANFPKLQKVQFVVGGEVADSLCGHVYIREPFGWDTTYAGPRPSSQADVPS